MVPVLINRRWGAARAVGGKEEVAELAWVGHMLSAIGIVEGIGRKEQLACRAQVGSVACAPQLEGGENRAERKVFVTRGRLHLKKLDTAPHHLDHILSQLRDEMGQVRAALTQGAMAKTCLMF